MRSILTACLVIMSICLFAQKDPTAMAKTSLNAFQTSMTKVDNSFTLSEGQQVKLEKMYIEFAKEKLFLDNKGLTKSAFSKEMTNLLQKYDPRISAILDEQQNKTFGTYKERTKIVMQPKVAEKQ